jgi:6,7-dimethyl-8-ribityllumazine synthase
MTKILIIEARFYDHIADGLLDGATAALKEAGASWDVLTVPGIYELPAALEMVAASAHTHYDGYVTLGTAILGETDHYHHVSAESMAGIREVSVRRHLALGNGVLTVHNEAQALARSDVKRKNMGGQAARACLRMLSIKRDLKLA